MPGRRIERELAESLSPIFGDQLSRARLHCGFFARVVTSYLRAEAFVLGRRIFLSPAAAREVLRRSPESLSLLAHELVHVAQFRRHHAVPFLARYLAEYLRHRLEGASHSKAYHAISFEREAEETARDFSLRPFV